MFTVSPFSVLLFAGAVALSALPSVAERVEAVISVADQRMVVLKDGGMIARYPVSTSKFGVGDGASSYKTPLGKLKVCGKVGDNLACGTVLKHRQATSEVLKVNAPGRDPIVTRILWLEGCEAQNANARGRSIYIHGTPEESRIGKPVSWGCVRMRSQDVVSVFDALPVGSSVTIIPEKLPRYAKYTPPPPEPVLIAKKEAAPTPEPAKLKEKEKPELPAIAARDTAAPKPARLAVSAVPKSATAPASSPMPMARATAVPKAPVAAGTHIAAQFTTTPLSAPLPRSNGGTADFTQAMRTSILASGMQDHSGNAEIPHLQR